MRMLLVKAKDKNKIAQRGYLRYLRGLRNENGELLVNLYESNTLEITHSRVVRDGYIWEGISLTNAY